MADGDELLSDTGAERLNDTGQVLDDAAGNICCCPVCFSLFTITYSCTNSTWGAWTNAGNFCLNPATTSTARTHTTGGGYQQYVQAAGPVNCTADGDCTGHDATAPAVPTDTPHDATGTGCTPCGCSHPVSFTATVTIAGTTSCTACFASGTGSAKVTGNVDNTYVLERLPGGTCTWQKTFAGPTLCRDCFSTVCTNCGDGGILDSPTNQITVKLQQVGANLWRITVTNSPGGATFFYDSGNFAWTDTSACDGTASAAQANTSPGCTLATGCAPSWAASGGNAMASFP